MTIWSRIVSLGFLGVLLLISISKQLALPLNQDNAVHLKAARVILEHGNLYTHFFETNPPMFPWLTTIPVAMAQITGLSEHLFYDALVFCLAFAVLLISVRMLRQENLFSGLLELTTVSGVWLMILIGLQQLDFGQRDHIVGILAVPYGVSLGVRLFRTRQSLEKFPIPILVALMLGIAIAIKPHFVFIWIFGEIALACVARSTRSIFSLGNAGIVLLGATYIAAVAILEPTFFSEILPLVHETYGAYGGDVDLSEVGMWLYLSTLQVLLFYFVSKGANTNISHLQKSLILAFFLTSQGAWVGYLLQAHYSYHLWPFYIMTCWSFALVLVGRRERKVALDQMIVSLRVATPLILIAGLIVLTPGWAWKSTVRQLTMQEPLNSYPWSEFYPDLESVVQLIDHHAAGENVFMFSEHVYLSFPAEHYDKAEWPMRYHTLWPLAGLAGKEGPTYDRYRNKIRSQVTEDLVRYRPAIVFVDQTPRKRYFPVDQNGEQTFDFLDFFNQSKEFRTQFSEYTACGAMEYLNLDILEVFVLKSDANLGNVCRDIVLPFEPAKT